jgi:hypothetical protein
MFRSRGLRWLFYVFYKSFPSICEYLHNLWKCFWQVKLLKSEFGFDDAFNYKTEKDWNSALTKYVNSLLTRAESQIILTLNSWALQHCSNNSIRIHSNNQNSMLIFLIWIGCCARVVSHISTCVKMLKISISRLFTFCVRNVSIISAIQFLQGSCGLVTSSLPLDGPWSICNC